MFNELKIITALMCLSFFVRANAQLVSDSKIDSAFNNAKKGIYWSLSNLPEKKSSLENDLIIRDNHIASVKAEKQINGFKIVSTGYFESYEVQIKLFKSNEALINEGFVKPDSLRQPEAKKEKSIKKKKE